MFMPCLGVGDVLSLLAPASSGATLLQCGIQFQFDGTGIIQVHGIAADKSNATFVAQGSPIPVRKFDLAPVVLLQVRKFAAIAAFTKEVLNHSTPNVELLVRQVMSESYGLAFDDKMFDANAADATRPAGLRNGISASSASAATASSEAMAEDVATLVGATTAVAGNNPIIFVAAPKQAAALRLWSRPLWEACCGLGVVTTRASSNNTLDSGDHRSHARSCRQLPRPVSHDRKAAGTIDRVSYSILAGIVSITSPVTGSILRTGDAAPCDPYHCFIARFSAALAAACQPRAGFRYFSPPDIGFLFRMVVASVEASSGGLR